MSFISVIGAIGLCLLLWRFLLYPLVTEVLFPFVLVPALSLAKDLKDLVGNANWAVVTGATDGIGKAYAKQLCQRGFNLVLVSRNQEKLDDTAEELKAEVSGADVKTVAFDFTTADSATYGTVFEEIRELDVGVLVNNVGVSFDYPEQLHSVERDKARDLVVVNCISPTMMSHIFLGQMVQRGRGLVINVASAAAFNATPYLGIYSASKVFVDYLTKSQQLEYRKSGITFQCVFPYFVATKMSKIKRATFFAPSPDNFASSALKTVGWTARTTGCLAHAIQNCFLRLLPSFFINMQTINFLEKIRERALQRKEKAQ